MCRMDLARKRSELTQRIGIWLRKQAVVFRRREGSKTAQWDVGTEKCRLARAVFFYEINLSENNSGNPAGRAIAIKP